MNSFAERYGYVTSSRIYLREKITPELVNAICNNIELLRDRNYALFYSLERYMWYKVLNNRLKDFGNITKGFKTVTIEYIENPACLWYEKFDYLEKFIACLKEQNEKEYIWFTKQLNSSFRSQHFVYRIENEQIVEIDPEEEDKPQIPLALPQSPRNTGNYIRATLRSLFQFLPLLLIVVGLCYFLLA